MKRQPWNFPKKKKNEAEKGEVTGMKTHRILTEKKKRSTKKKKKEEEIADVADKMKLSLISWMQSR